MDDQLLLLKKYPHLVPLNENFTAYDGYIQVAEQEFRISLLIPFYPSLRDVHLKSSWLLRNVLNGRKEELNTVLQSSTCVYSLLENLHSLIERAILNQRNISSKSISSDTYHHILKEISCIELDKVHSIVPGEGRATLLYIDVVHRVHYLSLIFNSSNKPTIHTDLPAAALTVIKSKNTSVAVIYQTFCQQIQRLQNFWLCMEEVDKSCWVIDPENPSKAATSRRIIIADNTSMEIHVDPWNPNARPVLKFLGPEKMITHFKDKMISNLQAWNMEKRLLENLQLALGIDGFCSRPTASEDDNSLINPGECCICFCLRLENELPSEVCEEEKCGSIFHCSCLFQYLQSLANHHQSFDRISGNCPNCGMTISCPLPS